MQRKSVVDFTTTRTSRIDRFAQMSKVEQVIEQKKREIQARLQKSDINADNSSPPTNNPQAIITQPAIKAPIKSNLITTSSNEVESSEKGGTNTCVNIFSNDGSFLDQFKQLNKETSTSLSHIKKKSKSENTDTENYSDLDRLEEKKNSDRSKSSRWSSNRDSDSYSNNGSYSNYSKQQRYQEKNSRFEQNSKNYIPPLINKHNNYQHDLKNTSLHHTSAPMNNTLLSTNYPPPSFSGTLNVPPPSHIQNNLLNQLPINVSNSIIHETGHKSSLSISSTPPIQLQNIPPPLPIRLNEIPNPKPLDIQNIPPPGHDKNLINAEVLKNIPPPNKSIPPPCINPTKPVDSSIVNINVSYPPPTNTSIPIVPPPVLATQTTIPPPSTTLTSILHQGQFSTTLSSVPQSNPLSSIPPLMAQPVLPPAGINICIQPQINLPPPPITTPCVSSIMGSTAASVIPSLLTQPPPNTQITNSIPPMTVPPPNMLSSTSNNAEHCLMRCEVCPIGSESYAAMSSVARMVAQCGTSFEDAVRQRSHQDPKMWFIYDKNSPAYHQYQELVNQFKAEMNQSVENTEYKPEDLYEPDNISNVDDRINNECEDSKKDIIIRYPLKDPNDIKKEKTSYTYSSNFSAPIKFESESHIKEESESDSELNDSESSRRRKRKRKSRWGNQSISVPPPAILSDVTTPVIALPSQVAPLQNNVVAGKDSVLLTKVTRTDPALIQYAMNTFGTTNLTEEDWQKAEDHYKINLLYQDMLRKRQELERLQKAGKFKYEYDSDEEVDGGTWEHKIRMQEMEATALWATELTKKAEGKHHIGDFLPPEELRKFLEQSTAAKEGREPDLSDYKEYKLNSDNIGFKMLQKLGWSEGQGLGIEGSGIVEPVNKASQRDSNQGLGLTTGEVRGNDDEYDAYRKRMMLAYRFRPNPLNNPRRPYY